MQFARVTNDFIYDWQGCAESCFNEMYEDFQDDPEGCADEEMSYWD